MRPAALALLLIACGVAAAWVVVGYRARRHVYVTLVGDAGDTTLYERQQS
jgi:hypothetical protein